MRLSANAAQAQRWNGATGRYWVQHRERHFAEQQNLTPYLFRAAAIRQGDRVLDVGCGCGETTIKAAQAAMGGATGREATWLPGEDKPWRTGGAVGVDLSAPMLDVAEQLKERSGPTNVEFVQGDAQVYPFRPNSFDIMISSFGLMFFEDPREAFGNLATALRPGGRLAFLCWQDDTENEVWGLPQRVFRKHLPLPGPGINKLFYSRRKIKSLLTKNGWRNVRITSVDEKARIGSDVLDVMSYVRGMPSTLTLAAKFKDQAMKEKVLAEVEAEYARREHSDGVWVDAAAWLVTARRA